MVVISRAARFAVLLLSAGGLALSLPAEAKKKEAPAAPSGPPPIKLSNEVRAAAVKAQMALQAGDLLNAEPAIAMAEALAKTDDELYFTQTLRLQLVSKKLTAEAAGDSAAFARGEQVLIKPLDALIANPRTPAADVARYTGLRGNIEYDARRFNEARAYFERAKALGYKTDDLDLVIVKTKLEGGDIPGGIAGLKALIASEAAAGRKAPESWYRYAVAKLNAAKLRPEMVEWLQTWAGAYPTPKNWRDAIVIYGFQGSSASALDKRQRIDLFRLMRATNALADQVDYSEYAQICYDLGLPSEAIAVIKEGRASGKIPATAGAGILTDAQRAVAADAPFATLEKQAVAAKSGDTAAQTADAYLSAGNFAKAVEFYTLAVGKGVSKADDVNTHLGIAQGMTGDKVAAKASFAKVSTMPRSEIAGFWLVWADLPTTPAG